MNIEYKWYKNVVPKEAREIRNAVFIDEQGVMPEEEFDGSDDYSEGVVLYLDNKAVATGRIIVGERGECLIGRVACLKECRGKGIGKVLMEELLRRCKEKGFDAVYVHAQTRVRGFYESLGFNAYGQIFMEADIPHVMMKIEL